MGFFEGLFEMAAPTGSSPVCISVHCDNVHEVLRLTVVADLITASG